MVNSKVKNRFVSLFDTKKMVESQASRIKNHEKNDHFNLKFDEKITFLSLLSFYCSVSHSQTCSQLIKTSLKLSLEMKRKMSTSDSSSVDTSICKKIKPDLDSSDDDEMMIKPSRSSVFVSGNKSIFPARIHHLLIFPFSVPTISAVTGR